MTGPSKQRVISTLTPYLSDLGKIPIMAFDDWMHSSEFSRSEHGRTRASIMWERMVAHGREKFELLPNWEIKKHFGTMSFIVDDSVLFRFKKGDENGLSNNYRTQLSLAFHDPTIEDLFGLCPLDRVEIVYILNKLETKIIDVRIVARNGDDKVWEHSILPKESRVIKAQTFPENIPSDLVGLRDNKATKKIENMDK